MTYYLGTSGWYYKHWAGRFYPMELQQRDWLPYYATKFSTIEVNASFYRLPTEAMIQGWHDKTPEHFTFAFKGSRIITHLKKLNNTSEYLTVFYDRITRIGKKLGIILWQLPPTLPLNTPLLESFLADLNPDLRQAIEFRHPSWFTPEAYRLLERYHIGLCIISAPILPIVTVTTASFAYIRWHGDTIFYATNYSPDQITEWAETIRTLPVTDVYGYFNNDAFAYAPANCLHLKTLLER